MTDTMTDLELHIPDDAQLVVEQFCSTSRDWCADSYLQSITVGDCVILVHNDDNVVGVLPVGHTCDLRTPGNRLKNPGDIDNSPFGVVLSDKLKSQLIPLSDDQLEKLTESLERRKK